MSSVHSAGNKLISRARALRSLPFSESIHERPRPLAAHRNQRFRTAVEPLTNWHYEKAKPAQAIRNRARARGPRALTPALAQLQRTGPALVPVSSIRADAEKPRRSGHMSGRADRSWKRVVLGAAPRARRFIAFWPKHGRTMHAEMHGGSHSEGEAPGHVSAAG